jgi:hypothetical protein
MARIPTAQKSEAATSRLAEAKTTAAREAEARIVSVFMVGIELMP